MLITIDIGNTSIHAGVFENDKLLYEFREKTLKNNSDDIYASLYKLIKQKTNNIDGIVIGSVVPELDNSFEKLCVEYFNISPLFVSTKLRTGIKNLSEKDTPLGADRLADIVAGITNYPGNKIIVDLGTATKFEVISQNNEYLGGAISPGFQSSFDALIQKASKLSSITLVQPEKITGAFTTKGHLNSGFIYGFASLIEGMIKRIKNEQNWESSSIILTGGYSALISKNLDFPVIQNPNLTLQGLQILWKINKN